MSEDKTGGQAFPMQACDITGSYDAAQGMTLLDYFAGEVIGRLVVSDLRQESTTEGDVRYTYDVAEAMIAERARRMK